MRGSVRLVLMPGLARQLTRAWGLEDTCARCSVRRLRGAVAHAARAARHIGTVTIGTLELRLPIYRAEVLGRRVEVLVRPTRGGVARVLAIVPAADVGDPGDFELTSGPVPGFEVPQHEAELLALELLAARDDEALEHFFGKVFRAVKRAAGSVTRAAGKVAKAVGRVGPIKGVVGAVRAVGKGIGKAINAVDKFVPVKALAGLTPYGLAARAAGAANRVLKGGNVFKVAGDLVKAGVKDIGKAAQFASTVASFVPGVGTGVGAALGAASALASGRPITEALVAAARGAVPGGALAQAPFDVAANVARGKSLTDAALGAVRSRIPGGAAAQAAFDAGLALSRGQKIQQAVAAAAGRVIPASPFASDALSFARNLAAGQPLQHAALSSAGRAALAHVQREGETGKRPLALVA